MKRKNKLTPLQIITYIYIMKNILTIASIALMGLVSCSKDEKQSNDGNSVIYTIRCTSCAATFDTMNGTTRTFEVKGFIQHAEINKLNLINLSITGTGEIQSSIKVNDKLIHDSIDTQDGNTVNFAVKVD